MNAKHEDKPATYFRGYWSIQEVIGKVEPLVSWMKQNKPDVHEVTLNRKDYDLIDRWPKAASLFGVSSDGCNLLYKGFRLKHDTKPGRYES